MIINVTEHLKIELVPGKDAALEPLLILSATDTGYQRIILFLNEVLLLKDALTEAAVLLAEMDVQGINVTPQAGLTAEDLDFELDMRDESDPSA